MACLRFKNVLKKGLCPRDLDKQIIMYKRGMTETRVDGTLNDQQQLIKVGDFMTGIESINPISRQFMTGISDKVTHIFYFMYSSNLASICTNKTYIKLRDDLYRMESFYNDGENNRFIAIFCEYRGSGKGARV